MIPPAVYKLSVKLQASIIHQGGWVGVRLTIVAKCFFVGNRTATNTTHIRYPDALDLASFGHGYTYDFLKQRLVNFLQPCQECAT